MKILCYGEDISWFKQFLTAVDKIHGEAAAVTTKPDIAEEVSKYYEKVYVADVGIFNPEVYGKFVAKVADEVNPDVFIAPCTNKGRVVTGMYSGLKGTACVSDVMDLGVEGDTLVVTRLVYGGTAKATIKVKPPVSICISPGAFKEGERTVSGQVVNVDFKVESKVKVEFKPKEVTGNEPDKADVVVVAGRGVRNKEDLNMIMELANVLHGAWSVTRPLAADYGWTDTWIGISGLVITPKLYIGVGVSGQPHHIIGARGSKVIVAINKDPEAPIFEEADYGIVGDLYKVLPLLIKRLKGET